MEEAGVRSAYVEFEYSAGMSLGLYERRNPRMVRGWGDGAAYFADPDGSVPVLSCPA